MTPSEKALYTSICERYGRPSIDVFGPDSYRVILWDSHAHDGACCGQLSGHGTTLEEAFAALLDRAYKSELVTVNGNSCKMCENSCCY
jgi:hypothetical protein